MCRAHRYEHRYASLCTVMHAVMHRYKKCHAQREHMTLHIKKHEAIVFETRLIAQSDKR